MLLNSHEAFTIWPLAGFSSQKFSRIRIWYSMDSRLRYSSHLSPTNSLSASRHSILSDPNSLTKRSIKFIRSCILELPNFGIIWKRIGKAIPLYTMPRVRMLMFFVPNFQFVLSKTSLYCGSCSSRENINLATRSESSEYSDINLCILRNDDSAFALESKPQASFSKQTVCTLKKSMSLTNLRHSKLANPGRN